MSFISAPAHCSFSRTNSFTAGTQVNSGTVITDVTGISSGNVNMNGGTLGFAASGIGMHVATNGSSSAYNAITAGFFAGVVPISNWNNMDINHGTAPISPGLAGDTPAAVDR